MALKLLEHSDVAAARAPLSSAFTLPPQAYTDASIFEAERRQIFHRDWVCVARVDQVPAPGDYICVEVTGQPLVIARLRDGTLHAMSSVCLHRAMPVVEGQGNASSFSCPYHLWKYDLDGRLISAPMMEGTEHFPPPDCRLPAVALECWQGFIFVNLDPDASPLSPSLAGLDDIVANYRLDELVVAATTTYESPWNWKLLIENFMEAYHHIGPHRDTFQPVYPAKDARVVAAEAGHRWSALEMPSPHPADDDGMPAFPDLEPHQAHLLTACVVSPNLIFATSNNLVAWYEVIPRAVDDMHLRIHVLLRPEVAALDEIKASIPALIDGVRFIHDEDIPVNEGPWRGVNAPLTRAGRLSLHEAAIWHLNQYWMDRLGL